MDTIVEFTPHQALERVIEHREIFSEEMVSLMRQIMTGKVSDTLIAAIVVGLRVKKETIGEIAGAAEVMRELVTAVPVDANTTVLDIVGTGGDGSHTFNISTTAMFVAAAAGAKIAKHGGRSVSSSCGSADILEALGVNLHLSPPQIAQSIEQLGVGFMFAPNHHQAMRFAAPVRKELGVRTIFNILGPLTNPASARHHLIGVFHADLVGIIARVLQRLGSERALVVYGRNGIDELSLTGPTLIGELRNGNVNEYELTAEDCGLTSIDAKTAAQAFTVDNVAASKEIVCAVLANTPGPARDIVCLNAGASLYVAGIADTIADGVQLAQQMLASCKADQLRHKFVQFCAQFSVS